MRPLTRTREQDIEDIINKKVQDLDKKYESVLKKEENATKISDVMSKIKEKFPEKTDIAKSEHVHNDDEISCPTCKGHIHKLSTDGLTVKCTGPNCGKEYIMVDKSADYKCTACNTPVKKPDDDSKAEGSECLFCGNNIATKIDFSELTKRIRK